MLCVRAVTRMRQSKAPHKLCVLPLISLLLCCLIILSSCSGYKPIEPDGDDLTVVGQVAGKDVYLEELRFVAYTYRDILTSRYGEDIFEGENAEKYLQMLKELVYANITSGYATLLLCEEVYIGLGEKAIIEKVNATVSDMAEELGGMRKYKKYLKENHLTDHFLRYSTELQLLKNELMYVYIDDISAIENDDEKIYDLIKDEFICVRHVFIPHADEDAEKTIQEVSRRASEGENISALIEEYGKDGDMSAEGLAIPEGYMTDEYEKIAFALDIGEISDVVEDDLGYYVIQRLDLSPATIMLKFDYLKELYQAYAFYAILDEKQATLTFVPNEAGEAYMNAPFDD